MVSTLSCTQPERDDAGVDTGVQKPHGGGVSQHVGSDGLPLQRRAVGGCLGGVVGEAVFDRVAAERCAAAGREQRIGVVTGLVVEPAAECGDGVAGERGDPVLRPLPWQATWAPTPRWMSVRVSAVSSEIGSPVWTASSSRAWSRRPVQVVRTQAPSSVSTSASVR